MDARRPGQPRPARLPRSPGGLAASGTHAATYALNGALFATFASFWIILPAYLEWFSKSVPKTQEGHASGLLLYTFAIVAAMFLLVSFRTNIATLLALGNLVVTLVLLGAGNYGGYSAPVHAGGFTGIVLAAQVLYLAAAGIWQHTYGRSVIPLGPLGPGDRGC